MAERRTSAAKDILTPREQAMLETYGVAVNHFDHARDPTISQQLKDMDRQKELEKAREERGSILADGGQFITEPHERPAGVNDNSRDQEGSKMVRDDRPKHDLRPPEEFAKASDRETFDKKWFEEQLRAEQNAPEQDRSYGREPDREP